MTLDNCTYDQIKILHELSMLEWFIKKHALEDARNNDECTELLKRLHADLEKYTAEFKRIVCKDI